MKIYLVGTGMGKANGLTQYAANIIENSNVLIGAKRMLENYRLLDVLSDGLSDKASKSLYDKKVYESYKPGEIKEYIDSLALSLDAKDKDDMNIAVLLSGDTGFFSGANKISEVLSDYDISIVPGISSVSYFFARIGLSWEDAKLISLHGRKCNAVGYIKKNNKTFGLLSSSEELSELINKLKMYDMNDIIIHVGYNMSYEDECIESFKVSEFDDTFLRNTNLIVFAAVNANPDRYSYRSIEDEEFIRDKVPMTKQEIRNVSIGKLKLETDSVLYDIGAGTGSVSIEAAMMSPDIKVYAFEKNNEAIKLIEENKKKFAADNVEIIDGDASESLERIKEANILSVVAPTHAFIGGSGKKMKEIVDSLFTLNPNIRIVINTISLESLNEATSLINSYPELDADIVCMNVAKSKPLGDYHMMMGMNPVYIITIKKEN